MNFDIELDLIRIANNLIQRVSIIINRFYWSYEEQLVLGVFANITSSVPFDLTPSSYLYVHHKN